ncbi:periplasmic binding protein [Methanosalsum zhilinae DSM 4017]|uniref:Periplasmic binding protein n=1 Tax=Methanosalsum zhilinae (strain DSM 4017 / NBRC 107636 / OCM 62 / WeN5) TaxID=679901 RepID=F7XKR7_METZD|nr:cobalamin-binding protein [Methanosalsum zhilinae]AEH61780.1 periplasmic binding protein [Methanosalsum zhilinae DSM 4017]
MKIITLITVLLIAAAMIPAVQADSSHFPITITDEMGNEVTIDKKPERIVSLSPSNTEILFAVGAGDQVVGVTDYSDYPPQVEELPLVGGFYSLSIERVVSLEPDLIVAQVGNGEDTVNMLKDIGFPVIVLNPETVHDIITGIEIVGDATGNSETARVLATGMSEHIDSISSKNKHIAEEDRPGVLYVVWFDPIYVAGKNTYPGDLIEMVGGKNIITAEGWPIASLEDIVAANPEIIICSSMATGSDVIAETIKKNPLMAQTDAVKNGNVFAVEEPSTIERPGPRIVQGIDSLHEYMSSYKQQNNNSADADIPRMNGAGILAALSMMLLVYTAKCRKK